MAHKKHHHTGKHRHSDQKSYFDGVGGKDPHADASHHAANKKHDMPEGMSPKGGCDGEDCDDEGGMADNEC